MAKPKKKPWLVSKKKTAKTMEGLLVSVGISESELRTARENLMIHAALVRAGKASPKTVTDTFRDVYSWADVVEKNMGRLKHEVEQILGRKPR